MVCRDWLMLNGTEILFRVHFANVIESQYLRLPSKFSVAKLNLIVGTEHLCCYSHFTARVDFERNSNDDSSVQASSEKL